MRKTIIVPWTHNWSIQFQEESSMLEALLGEELLAIHHIGSTSVPDIGYAKPIIDILIVVHNIHNVDKYNGLMTTLGYIPRGENGIPNRRYFTKGKEQRSHHVHIHQLHDERISAHLNFKQYLIAHPREARSYGQVKLRLAKLFPDDIHLYQQGKESFVNQLVASSKQWAASQS